VLRKSLAALVVVAAICAVAHSAEPAAGKPPAALEVLVLGSGGPAALGRAASSYLVLLEGEPRLLVDAGPGSFARLGEAHVSLAALDTVLLTHLHVDHAAELPGIVKARAVSATHPIHFDVYGPAGHPAEADGAPFPSTREFMRLLFGAHGAFAYLKDFSAPVSFDVSDLPIAGAAGRQPRSLLHRGALSVTAIAGHHGDAPAIIYRIEYRGRSVVFSGDVDAHGLPALETLARGANLLVFDAVVLDPPGSPEVLYSLHTPPHAIGAVAARSGAGMLLLSHLSPPVDGDRAAVTASVAGQFHGVVQFAADGLRVQP